MPTKRDIITDAFAELGLAAYIYDLQPEQLETAKRSLDRMMATWGGQGIVVGYPLGTASDIDDETNAPDWALEAMVQNLALRIAPGFGKTVSPDTKAAASMALNVLGARRVAMVPMVPDTMAIPAGAGGVFRAVFLSETETTLDLPSGPIDLE